MLDFLQRNPVLDLAGAALTTAYGLVASGTTGQNPRGSALAHTLKGKRARYYINFIKDAASTVATITLKLTCRYNDGTITTNWVNLGSSSELGVLGAEQALTVGAAGATWDWSFYVDNPNALMDVAVDAKADVAGSGTDRLRVRVLDSF